MSKRGALFLKNLIFRAAEAVRSYSKLNRARSAIKAAKKSAKTFYDRELTDVDDKAKKAFLNEYFNDVDTMLAELRYYKNYCETEYNMESAKARGGSNARTTRLGYAESVIDDLISEIEEILHSGDIERIKALVKNCEDFYNKHAGGINIKDLYKGAQDLKFSVMRDSANVTSTEDKPMENRDNELPLEIRNNEISSSNTTQVTEKSDLIKALEESGLYEEDIDVEDIWRM